MHRVWCGQGRAKGFLVFVNFGSHQKLKKKPLSKIEKKEGRLKTLAEINKKHLDWQRL